jgi:hypothetical protein
VDFLGGSPVPKETYALYFFAREFVAGVSCERCRLMLKDLI